MRLRELDASFVRREAVVDTITRVHTEALDRGPPYMPDDFFTAPDVVEHIVFVENAGDAQGVMFLCPLCYAKNGGPVGTHRVLCWFSRCGVPDFADPRPGRWIPDGDTLDDVTFIGPAAASVLLTSGCRWHGFVRNGDAS